MESRTYLEGSGNTDEVQVLLFHSFGCGDKSRVGGFSLSSLDSSCHVHICSNPTENEHTTPDWRLPLILCPHSWWKSWWTYITHPKYGTFITKPKEVSTNYRKNNASACYYYVPGNIQRTAYKWTLSILKITIISILQVSKLRHREVKYSDGVVSWLTSGRTGIWSQAI